MNSRDRRSPGGAGKGAEYALRLQKAVVALFRDIERKPAKSLALSHPSASLLFVLSVLTVLMARFHEKKGA